MDDKLKDWSINMMACVRDGVKKEERRKIEETHWTNSDLSLHSLLVPCRTWRTLKVGLKRKIRKLWQLSEDQEALITSTYLLFSKWVVVSLFQIFLVQCNINKCHPAFVSCFTIYGVLSCFFSQPLLTIRAIRTPVYGWENWSLEVSVRAPLVPTWISLDKK